VVTTSITPASEGAHAFGWSQARRYVLVVLAGVALLNTLDQSILSVTSPAIQADFGLADSQIGVLSGAFVVVYGLAALPAGYWVDRFSRRSIVALGVGLWSVCTLFTGFAFSYPQMLLARTALGVGEATTVPASVSLLGDYFTRADRGRAVGIVQAALQVGLALGLIGGGIVAARFGWRAAFYVAVLPGLVLALFSLQMNEPLRGAAEAHGPIRREARDAGVRAFIQLLRIRTLVAAILANTFAVFAQTGVGAFIAIYATRQFGADLAQVGAMVGVPLLLGGLMGNAAGGWLVDWRSRRSPRAHLEVSITASLLCAGGMAATFSAGSPQAFSLLFFVAVLLGNAGMPALLSITQNLVIPSLRGSATALQQVASNILGRALGVVLIGVLADQLHDLHITLLLLAPMALLLATISAWFGMTSMSRDVAAMEEDWKGATTISH
jgi:MFS transporter, Spinster family, sphingosine-1-phosphate transporter